MAGKSRGKRRGGGQRHHQGHHQPISHTNTFASLQNLDGVEGSRNGVMDDMNTHLVERFEGRKAYGTSQTYPQGEHASAAGPQKPSADVQKYFDAFKQPVPGSTWVTKPEIPTSAEILRTPIHSPENIIDVAEELRPNKIADAYDSNEDYLSTQYDLLREDCIRPLREAVEQVRSSPYLDEAEYEGGSIGLYDPVYITSVVFSPRGLATRVAFSLGRVKKHVRWDQSKRLITGTLVALSPADDNFQHKCVLATVAARPISALDQNPPEIDLFFHRSEDIEIDPMKKWIMVENRSSFFEASRHTMRALQHMMHEPFPMSEHIVKSQKHTEPPTYLQTNPHVDMSSLVAMEEQHAFQNVNILQQWPSSKSHGLDVSQSRALKRILTHRLAIVQGPPGTGKTYVSIEALRILLANLQPEDPPIVVTCQTNHALDQLLRHVAEFEPRFIRLGGRSKDKDKIKKRTLYEVRNSTSQPRSQGGRKFQAIREMKRLTNEMQLLLSPLEANKPPLDHRVLLRLGLISPEQAESLEMDAICAMGISADTPGIQMEQWLGKCLVPCLRPVQPDDFGMEFEEEDFEVEQLQELEAEAVAQDDDDLEALKGPCTLLCDNTAGRGGRLRTDDEVRTLLRKADDLTTIAVADRGPIYNYFKRHTKRLLLAEFRPLAERYKALVEQRQIGQWESADHTILKEQRLIGMTTTGLSKYRPLIASLKPKIVLVEEAAETLEAPVTAACLPSLEHLILVGDHLQLRPHCQVRALEDEPYNFNLSLFERMVGNGVEIDCLTKQRRMIPEIRQLLEPIYGKTLKDHPSVEDVSNRPPVEGMGGCNSFFLTHEWPESRDSNMSCFNENEAGMVVGFFNYLVLNGVDPNKITVLTFYNGQRKVILKRLRQHQNFRRHPSLNVVTVDSYQGEENDIVLLSLVRSNRKYQIGFLEVDNRVCVALSRAKRGFYIFGNAQMLASESRTWSEVVEIMYGKKKASNPNKVRHLGYHLPLVCANHNYKTFIEQPDDWEYINGGCDLKCRCSLPCGHTCMLRCHPFDSAEIACTQKCKKYVPLCGHACTALCCDSCKCGFCERHNDGTRAMLRPSQGSRAPRQALQPAQPSQPLGPVIATDTMQTHISEHMTEHSGRSIDNWQAYADGGARADDAEFMRKVREEETDYLKARNTASGFSTDTLIELSPTNPKSGQNAHLLVDLDAQIGARSPGGRAAPMVYAPSARKSGRNGKENAGPNLLD